METAFFVYVQVPTGWARCKYGCANFATADGLGHSFAGQYESFRVVEMSESDARAHYTDESFPMMSLCESATA